MRKRFRIYLMGPISGCNEEQRTGWRREVRSRWGREFDFIDPTDPAEGDGKRDGATPWEIVDRDAKAIASADAVLADMWKESIGTAIGVFHARSLGRVVVVVDRNDIRNSILAYYADAVARTGADAMRQLRDLLRAEERLHRVLKRGGKEEEFRRDKLAQSLRAACREAGQDDVIAPAEIVPRVIQRLLASSRTRRGAVSTTAVRDAVWQTLADLESDPLRAAPFSGIRASWEAHDARRRAPRPGKRVLPPAPADPWMPRVHDRPLAVRCSGTKAHTSIWDVAIRSVDDLPPAPREAFRQVCRVEGIAEIRFGQMGQASHGGPPRIELVASKSPRVIEGRCFDRGKKGGKQSFQVRVHDAGRADAIREALLAHLLSTGFLRPRETL